MTTSVNPPLTQAEQIFKTLIWDPMIAAGERWLAAEEAPIPVLALFDGLEDAAIQAIADWTFGKLVLWVDVTSLQLMNAAHNAAYTAAFVNLIAISEKSGIQSQEYIDAQNAALAALSQFTHFN